MSTTVFPLVYMFGGGFPKLHILRGQISKETISQKSAHLSPHVY